LILILLLLFNRLFLIWISNTCRFIIFTIISRITFFLFFTIILIKLAYATHFKFSLHPFFFKNIFKRFNILLTTIRLHRLLFIKVQYFLTFIIQILSFRFTKRMFKSLFFWLTFIWFFVCRLTFIWTWFFRAWKSMLYFLFWYLLSNLKFLI
jgi:hypothetical protein